MENVFAEVLANGSLAVVLVVKFIKDYYSNKKYREEDEKYRKSDKLLHKSLYDGLTTQGRTIEQLGVFLRRAASGYTRTMSYAVAKEMTARIFDSARMKIERGVIDMLEDLNWNNPHVRTKFNTDIEKYCRNVYDQDVAFLKGLDYNNKSLSSYMQEVWVEKAVEVSKDFVAAHFERGNNFDKFNRSLKTEFINFHNDYVKSLNV